MAYACLRPITLLTALAAVACEEVPAGPPAPGSGCLALSHYDKRDACEAQTCLPRDQAVRHVEPDGGRLANNWCGTTVTNTDMISFALPRLSFVIHYAHTDCTTPLTTARLRSALQVVSGEVELVDTRTGLPSVVSLGGGPEAVDELRIEGGRLVLRFHAPVASANMSSNLSLDCGSPNGSGLPIDVCNCVYEGDGPVVSLAFDVPLSGA